MCRYNVMFSTNVRRTRTNLLHVRYIASHVLLQLQSRYCCTDNNNKLSQLAAWMIWYNKPTAKISATSWVGEVHHRPIRRPLAAPKPAPATRRCARPTGPVRWQLPLQRPAGTHRQVKKKLDIIRKGQNRHVQSHRLFPFPSPVGAKS